MKCGSVWDVVVFSTYVSWFCSHFDILLFQFHTVGFGNFFIRFGPFCFKKNRLLRLIFAILVYIQSFISRVPY